MRLNTIPVFLAFSLGGMIFTNCTKESVSVAQQATETWSNQTASDRTVCFISVKADCPVNVCGSQTNEDLCAGLKGTEVGVEQAIYSLSVPAKVQFTNLPFGQNCEIRITGSLNGRQTVINLSSGQSKLIKVGDNCGIEVVN